MNRLTPVYNNTIVFPEHSHKMSPNKVNEKSFCLTIGAR